jgi:H+/Cl- antiporter ClcA
MEIFGVPLLACIFICIAACVGGYLLTKPQEYKDELSQFEDVISKWPRWLVRILGLFLIVFAGCLFYLFSRSPK